MEKQQLFRIIYLVREDFYLEWASMQVMTKNGATQMIVFNHLEQVQFCSVNICFSCCLSFSELLHLYLSLRIVLSNDCLASDVLLCHLWDLLWINGLLKLKRTLGDWHIPVISIMKCTKQEILKGRFTSTVWYFYLIFAWCLFKIRQIQYFLFPAVFELLLTVVQLIFRDRI